MSTPIDASDPRATDAQSEEQRAHSVGVQNYVFGLPLTIFERERSLRLDPAALEKAKKFAPAAPINQIDHMKTLATADYVMPYTPNNDTVYSGALLELGDEPMILTAPDISDRYWSNLSCRRRRERPCNAGQVPTTDQESAVAKLTSAAMAAERSDDRVPLCCIPRRPPRSPIAVTNPRRRVLTSCAART